MAGNSVVASLLSQYKDELDKVINDGPTCTPRTETIEQSIKSMASMAHVAGSDTV